jgi:hypothetical protein
MSDVTKWLREDEAKLYLEHLDNCEIGNIAREEHLQESKVYESLATCKQLMKATRYEFKMVRLKLDTGNDSWHPTYHKVCKHCDRAEGIGCANYCKINAQLTGLPRSEEKQP